MSAIVVSCIGAAALIAVSSKGPRWAFCWVYLPALLLVPLAVSWNIRGLPDLTAARAACLAIVLGAVVRGSAGQLIPRWRRFDLIALLPVISFSISYGLGTDFKGFYHRLAVLLMDWAGPYLFTRALLQDLNALRAALRPLALCSILLAGLAVYECRMAVRLSHDLWNLLGLALPPLPHFASWRWGLLRAGATFGAPIEMGTFFATAAPLMVLWGLLDPAKRRISWLAALACAVGCVSSLSRGPMLVLGAVAMIFWLAAVRRKHVILLLFAGSVVASPLLISAAKEEVRYTESRLEETGNTAGESAHYRIALVLIYGKRILDVGWWGDRTLVGLEYEKAWSIDNAYLYLFLMGGWIGGGAFCIMVIGVLYQGAKRIRRTVGFERKVLVAALASFASVAGCMANIWFSPVYVAFFWIPMGMVLNLLSLRAGLHNNGGPRWNRGVTSGYPMFARVARQD